MDEDIHPISFHLSNCTRFEATAKKGRGGLLTQYFLKYSMYLFQTFQEHSTYNGLGPISFLRQIAPKLKQCNLQVVNERTATKANLVN